MRAGPSTKCTKKCTGDSSDYCGGINANSVWSFAKPAPFSAATTCSDTVKACWQSIGCFKSYGTDGRDFDTRLWDATGRGLGVCAREANKAKFKYFGMMGGEECYGSNTTARATAAGTATTCNAECKGGGPTGGCGGIEHDIYSIYQVGRVEMECMRCSPA